MGDVDGKLRRGIILVEDADGDADLLGVALLALHGAIEDYLHAALLAHPQISPEERQILAERNLGWVPRANLAQKYGLLTREQRQRILEANDARQAFAHGAPLNWRDSDLRRYAQFAAGLCGRQALLGRQRGAEAGRSSTQPATGPIRPAAPAGRRRDQEVAPPLPGSRFPRLLINLLVVLALLLGGVALSRRYDISIARISRSIGLIAPPTATPTATPIPPTPTPRVIQARLVDLGDGPGWLHDTPDFASGTQPIRLSEGQIVILLERQQTDAAGNLWRYVSVGGYEGWCPDNNLEILP